MTCNFNPAAALSMLLAEFVQIELPTWRGERRFAYAYGKENADAISSALAQLRAERDEQWDKRRATENKLHTVSLQLGALQKTIEHTKTAAPRFAVGDKVLWNKNPGIVRSVESYQVEIDSFVGYARADDLTPALEAPAVPVEVCCKECGHAI